MNEAKKLFTKGLEKIMLSGLPIVRLLLTHLSVLSLMAIVLGMSPTAYADEVGLDFNLPTYQPTSTANAISAPSTATTPAAQVPTVPQPVALSFQPPTLTPHPIATATPPEPIVSKVQPQTVSIFEGASDSLVARAVGSAEGTRTPEGHKTLAYYGHIDPGNGAWNLGSFSYQHGAPSPEVADARQLSRLQTQAEVIHQKAKDKGIKLTLEEELNGIDLANQAPLAALDRGGYIDWLAAAHKMGMKGSEAVLWARTRSYLNPDTGQWNAPGLGNNIYTIANDQERRQQAIARVLDIYQQPSPAAAPEPTTPKVANQPPSPKDPADRIILQDIPVSTATPSTPAPLAPLHPAPRSEDITQQIIFQDLSTSPEVNGSKTPAEPSSLNK